MESYNVNKSKILNIITSIFNAQENKEQDVEMSASGV